MSWFSDWFRQDSTKVFVSLILKACKLFIGRIVDDVWVIIKKNVHAAELTRKPGHLKAKMVIEETKKELGDVNVPSYLLNILMEAAVLQISRLAPVQ